MNINFNVDEEDDDLVDNFFNEIVRRRDIARRTNWRHRSIALSQREVALAATLQSAASFYVTLVFAVMITTNQVIAAIIYARRRFAGQDSPHTVRLFKVLIYYQCLLTFCFHELDILVEQDDALLNVRYGQLYPLEQLPPKNRAIDEISEEFAYTFTRFMKDQLRLMMVFALGYRTTGASVAVVAVATAVIISGLISTISLLFPNASAGVTRVFCIVLRAFLNCSCCTDLDGLLFFSSKYFLNISTQTGKCSPSSGGPLL
jgi:hypothetical protein